MASTVAPIIQHVWNVVFEGEHIQLTAYDYEATGNGIHFIDQAGDDEGEVNEIAFFSHPVRVWRERDVVGAAK